MFLDVQEINWPFIAIWGVVFIVTLIIELQTFNLTTIWFCIGSLVALIFGTLGASPVVQVIIFILLSIILLLITKPLANKAMNKDVTRTNTDRLVGMIAIVTKEIIPNEIGEVRVQSNIWRAINYDNLVFEIGEKVLINGISGVKLIVSKLDTKQIEK